MIRLKHSTRSSHEQAQCDGHRWRMKAPEDLRYTQFKAATSSHKEQSDGVVSFAIAHNILG
jgi:hypothetical protein